MSARTFATGPAWLAFLADRIGTHKWVVASRLTPRLRDKGYEAVISQKRYAELEEEYRASRSELRP